MPTARAPLAAPEAGALPDSIPRGNDSVGLVDGGIFFLNSRAGFMNEAGVKLRRLCLSVVAALVLVSPAVRSQLIEGGAKRFRHAFVDEQTGKRTLLLTGGSATNISNEELLIGDGVRLQFFDDTGKTNLEVASAACIYNLKTESVASTNRLEAASFHSKATVLSTLGRMDR